MKIKIVSNFEIPGIEGKDEISFDRPSVTLRHLLEELSKRSSGRIRYIKLSGDTVDHMNFEIEIKGVPNRGTTEELETVLRDGDAVTINLSPMGGG